MGEAKAIDSVDGTGVRKRSAYDPNDILNGDDLGATRDAKRRQHVGPEIVRPHSTIPKYSRPSPRPASQNQLARGNPPSSTGVSNDRSVPRPRLPSGPPPISTALAASTAGVSGGPKPASGGPRDVCSALSNPRRKYHLSNASFVSPHDDGLSFTAHQPAKSAAPRASYGFKAVNRTTVLRYGKRRTEDEVDDNGEPWISMGGKKEQGTQPLDSPDELSEIESDVRAGYDFINDADGVSPPTGPSSEEIAETPSGKPYNMFKNEDGTLGPVNGALFPDGYQLQHLADAPGYPYICPVRDCRKLFTERMRLVGHFKAAHARCHFIDNLDKDATLTVHRRVKAGRSIVVSQRPLGDNAPPLKPPTLPRNVIRRKGSEFDNTDHKDIKDTGSKPASLTETNKCAPPIRNQSEGSTSTGPSAGGSDDAKAARPSQSTAREMSVSGAANAKGAPYQNTIREPFLKVDATEIKTDVWTCIKPFVRASWLAAFQTERERIAFLQAIRLPKRNRVDEAWIQGTRSSHQKIYNTLMSLVFHVVGMSAMCGVCEGRSVERKRNCMILPPEAKDMRELQEVLGSQCVNCFFFPRKNHPCEFATAGKLSSNGVKKTPMPAPDAPLRPQEFEAQVPQAKVPQPNGAAEHEKGRDEGPARRSGLLSAREPEDEAQIPVNDVQDHGDLNSGPAGSDDVTPGNETASSEATTVVLSSTSDTPPPSSTVVSKAFTLFGEITQLPAHEQSKVYEKMAAMLEVASGTSTTTRAAAPRRGHDNVLHRSQVTAADGWEIAPGRLTSRGEPVAFSMSSLRREVVSLNSAQHVTPTEKVSNKHIMALDHLKLTPEPDWDCRFTVTKGLVKVKMGDVEAKMGYGGVFLVKRECIVTNILHDESHVQVWWKQLDG